MAAVTLPQQDSTAQEREDAISAAIGVETLQVAAAALDLSDEIKEASFYVLLRALLDAASMLGSVNMVELALWARWKMKYDTQKLAHSSMFRSQLSRAFTEV
jgi:hypothetical protein